MNKHVSACGMAFTFFVAIAMSLQAFAQQPNLMSSDALQRGPYTGMCVVPGCATFPTLSSRSGVVMT